MSLQPSLPDDPRLARTAEELAKTRWAAAICDKDWRLRWVSDELKKLVAEEDEKKIGYGRHMYENYLSETWRRTITPESQLETVFVNTPFVLHDTPGGKKELLEYFCALGAGEVEDLLEQSFEDMLEQIPEVTPPSLWATQFDFLYGDLPPLKVNFISMRLYDADADEFIGTVLLYGSALPASVLSLVGRGDEGMFERMTRLFTPGRREAAILFADLQSSATLSRRLPSAAYFKLIRALTTHIDDIVISHSGIVGKHAGDGVTAFFLCEDLGGSPTRAARAAIEAARSISEAGRVAALEVGEETGLISPDECRVNVGVHWGGTLYMGQVVTGGRLEITALGDEVNECARIQQTAREGAILASKALVERLSAGDAADLAIDEDALTYRTVAELDGAPDKAVRDAGSIPVTVIEP